MNIFFVRQRDFLVPPRWMVRAYMDRSRRENVYVAWPLNYLVQFAWWLNLKWAQYQHRPSWIDNEIKKRTQAGIMTKKELLDAYGIGLMVDSAGGFKK